MGLASVVGQRRIPPAPLWQRGEKSDGRQGLMLDQHACRTHARHTQPRQPHAHHRQAACPTSLPFAPFIEGSRSRLDPHASRTHARHPQVGRPAPLPLAPFIEGGRPARSDGRGDARDLAAHTVPAWSLRA